MMRLVAFERDLVGALETFAGGLVGGLLAALIGYRRAGREIYDTDGDRPGLRH